MSVRTDTVNLIVNINGNNAQNNLNELRKRAADITSAMQGLKKGTEEYITKTKELKQVNTDMDALKKQIGLTALSQKELIAELNKLKALKGSVVPFSAEFKTLQKDIEAVEKRLYDVRNGVQGFASFWSKVNDQVKQFGTMAAAYLGFQFITSQFSNIINGAGKLSDQLADLQRVSGLTAAEAKNLNNELSKIDTRTSTAGLREIAIIAGKLGVAKGDILEFTKATDQLVVALGDELGDAGAITDTLGKILNVFDGKITGDNISKLGNAFVELANTGASSGAWIADFDQRLSGIAKSAGIGLGALSGLGAGIEEMGGRVESSSTAIQKLISDISTGLPKAAKVANLSIEDMAKLGVKSFEELFAKNPTEALLRYSEGLVKNKESFSAITAALKENGEEGARSIEIITKLGTNADYLRDRIDLGTESIKKNNAITDAFNLKNETFGATIDKLGKEFNKLVSNSRLTQFIQGLIQEFTNLISPAQSLVDSFKKQQEYVTSLEKNISPLISRYEELKSKSTLNKDEQIELNKAISTIADTIPTAITQFDQYGRALGINAQKAREFINLQQLILKEKNRDAIKDQEDLLKRLQRDAEVLQRTLNSGKTEENISGGSGSFGGGTSIVRDLTGEEIKKGMVTLGELQQRIAGVKGIIDELKGDNLKKAIDPGPTSGETPNGNLKESIGLIKKLQDQIKGLDDSRPNLTSEKAIKDNLTQRKKLQDELDRLEGKDPKKSTDQKKYDDLKKEYQKFLDDLDRLKKKAEIKSEDPDQAEVDAVKEKYATLLDKAKDYFKELHIKAAESNKVEADLEAAKLQEILNLRKKQFDAGSEKNYKESLNEVEDYLSQQKQQYAKAYAEGRLTEQQYQEALTSVDQSGHEMRLKTAQNYSQWSKDAKNDEVKFSLALEAFLTNQTIEQVKKRKEIAERDAKAKAEREVLITRKGTDERYQAELNRMKVLHDLEMQNIDLTNEERKLKEAEYNEAVKELGIQRAQEQIAQFEEYAGYITQAFTAINSIITNRENADLQRDKKANDEKKNNYKKQLDNKLISQAQYDLKVKAADDAFDKKQKELQRKQAEREKMVNLFQAVINIPEQISKVLSTPWMIPIVAALGAVQVAAIANTPLPELAKGEYFTTGKKHSEGGIPVEIEKGEAVMSEPAMSDKDVVTVTGTTAQITSALNKRRGGTDWAPGAVVQMPVWRTSMPATINPGLPRIMQQGGYAQSTGTPGVMIADEETKEYLRQLVLEQRANTEEIKNMKSRLHAVVSIKEFDDQRKIYDAARRASGF